MKNNVARGLSQTKTKPEQKYKKNDLIVSLNFGRLSQNLSGQGRLSPRVIQR